MNKKFTPEQDANAMEAINEVLAEEVSKRFIDYAINQSKNLYAEAHEKEVEAGAWAAAAATLSQFIDQAKAKK